MKITFLGTGTSQGVPVIACRCAVCQSNDARDKRLRSSVMVEYNGHTLVIDTGPDFRQQMLREKVNDLTAVLFTHEHKDHVAGLDDVRAFNFVLNRPIDVYCEQRVVQALKREFAYVFAENKYPGIPRINIHTITNKAFSLHGIDIVPIRGMHYKLPVLGFRIGDFAYLTDLNRLPEEEYEKIKSLQVLVITALRKEKHLSHFCLSESLEVIKRIKPQQAFLTHLSHQFGAYVNENNQLPKGVALAYDGLSIDI